MGAIPVLSNSPAGIIRRRRKIMIEKIKNFVEIFFSRIAGWVGLTGFLFFGVMTFLKVVAPFPDPILPLGQGIGLFTAITATLFFFFQQLGTLFVVPKGVADKIELRVATALFLLIVLGLATVFFTVMLYLTIFLFAFLAGATEGQT